MRYFEVSSRIAARYVLCKEAPVQHRRGCIVYKKYDHIKCERIPECQALPGATEGRFEPMSVLYPAQHQLCYDALPFTFAMFSVRC